VDDSQRAAALERLRELLPYRWLCGNPDCDGQPHGPTEPGALGFLHPHARASQQPPPGDWLVWLILAGRGFGKTRTGAEWLKHVALGQPGTRWAVVAPTYADARDTCIEGESGLLATLPKDRVDTWNRSLGEVILTNGSRVKLFSAEDPDRLRGPQHHGAWCDELAAWNYPATWDQLQFGLRLGDHPRTVVTTTPKPTPLVKALHARPDAVVTRGSTFDNASNLSGAALAELRSRYEGTRLGRQELYAEILDDVEGALWTHAMIDANRATHVPDLVRTVVAIDPAGTSTDASDETGIVAAGIDGRGHLYVLADRSGRFSPDGWGRRAVDLYDEVSGDRIVAESNFGADMVEHVIRTVDPDVAYRKVTATRGKRLRAEPVAALYEQGRVHHVGDLGDLEDQMTSWTPDAAGSPDRLDALVWAITALALGDEPRRLRMRAAA
jgi:phage terminase large subunit-like protein